MTSPLVEAPGSSLAKSNLITNGFSRGRPGLKPFPEGAFVARLKPCPSTVARGHFFAAIDEIPKLQTPPKPL